jgi:hypothetical protein
VFSSTNKTDRHDITEILLKGRYKTLELLEFSILTMFHTKIQMCIVIVLLNMIDSCSSLPTGESNRKLHVYLFLFCLYLREPFVYIWGSRHCRDRMVHLVRDRVLAFDATFNNISHICIFVWNIVKILNSRNSKVLYLPIVFKLFGFPIARLFLERSVCWMFSLGRFIYTYMLQDKLC